jgi:hypothetical protein
MAQELAVPSTKETFAHRAYLLAFFVASSLLRPLLHFVLPLFTLCFSLCVIQIKDRS